MIAVLRPLVDDSFVPHKLHLIFEGCSAEDAVIFVFLSRSQEDSKGFRTTREIRYESVDGGGIYEPNFFCSALRNSEDSGNGAEVLSDVISGKDDVAMAKQIFNRRRLAFDTEMHRRTFRFLQAASELEDDDVLVAVDTCRQLQSRVGSFRIETDDEWLCRCVGLLKEWGDGSFCVAVTADVLNLFSFEFDETGAGEPKLPLQLVIGISSFIDRGGQLFILVMFRDLVEVVLDQVFKMGLDWDNKLPIRLVRLGWLERERHVFFFGIEMAEKHFLIGPFLQFGLSGFIFAHDGSCRRR